jgi:hypothetical protein
MLGMKRRARKVQPCLDLNDPAGINNGAATRIRPREKPRTNFNLRFISTWHRDVVCALPCIPHQVHLWHRISTKPHRKMSLRRGQTREPDMSQTLLRASNLIHATCYAISLYIVHFRNVLSLGEGQARYSKSTLSPSCGKTLTLRHRSSVRRTPRTERSRTGKPTKQGPASLSDGRGQGFLRITRLLSSFHS